MAICAALAFALPEPKADPQFYYGAPYPYYYSSPFYRSYGYGYRPYYYWSENAADDDRAIYFLSTFPALRMNIYVL